MLNGKSFKYPNEQENCVDSERKSNGTQDDSNIHAWKISRRIKEYKSVEKRINFNI